MNGLLQLLNDLYLDNKTLRAALESRDARIRQLEAHIATLPESLQEPEHMP